MRWLTPEMVLDGALLRAMAALFGMDKLYGGEGVRRDERGWIVRDAQGRKVPQPVARSLWVAEIRPAHLEPACLAVIDTAQRRMAGFVIETHPWFAEYPPSIMPIVPPTMVRIGPVDVDAAWDDPLIGALGYLDSSPRDHDQALALDGRAYTLFAGDCGSQIALAFSNPVTPSLIRVEQSILQVAKLLVAHDSTGALAQYIERWTRYMQWT